MVHVDSPAPQSPTPANGLAGCFLELAWGLGGFAALVLVGVLILKEHAWTITAKDAAYWSVVIGMLVTRLVSERRQTGVVPRQVVMRFAATLVPLAGLGWVIVQSFRV